MNRKQGRCGEVIEWGNKTIKPNHMWPDEPENSKTPLAQNIILSIIIIIIAGLMAIPLAIILSGL